MEISSRRCRGRAGSRSCGFTVRWSPSSTRAASRARSRKSEAKLARPRKLIGLLAFIVVGAPFAADRDILPADRLVAMRTARVYALAGALVATALGIVPMAG